MVDCSVNFDSYYHTLKALQSKDAAEFPMKKYIIDLKSDIDTIFHFDSTSKLDIETLKLNAGQYNAFRSALTKEFVIIQGVSGTGKTFLGIKIIKTLMENINYKPILVLCLTTNTLDEYVDSLIDTTLKIVRIGAPLRSARFKQFTLKNHQKLFKNIDNANVNQYKDLKKKICSCLQNCYDYIHILEDIHSNSVIIHFKKFSEIDTNIISSWFFNASDQELIDWLVGKKSTESNGFERNTLKPIQEDQENLVEFNEIFYRELRTRSKIYEDIDYKIIIKNDHRLTSIQELKFRINEIKRQKEDNELALEDQLIYLQMRLRNQKHVKELNKPDTCDLQNPHSMSADDRWQLYRYWLEQYRQYLTNKSNEMLDHCTVLYKEYEKIKHGFDLGLMQSMRVVGITVDAVAQYQTVVQLLDSPIVIVEEADQILEPHVITLLSSHCKHLILMGERKPKLFTSRHYIERHFNLNMSLLGRMLRNNIHSHLLKKNELSNQ
ncbi:hypothetical protein RN001_014954 [Aquatica leii]|uniref:DNA2/NAM7 helicase helicase domain-containing protein n=1 Tax=Aquatica leii TaxID=1421715 RepID=A0AAN7SNC0_9COLE|nr:hypothetical protein RN001_014954 [Aquatica leii]